MNLEILEQEDLGNTKPNPTIKQEIQTKNICFTLNNWTIEQKEHVFSYLKQNCVKFIFGEEVAPTTGTQHLQGAFILKTKQRFSQIKKALNIKSIHLEKIKGTWEQNIIYCSKGKNIQTNIKLPYSGQDLITELSNWQLDIINIIKNKPDKRKVYWYYDILGNTGKSSFTKYLCYHYKAIKISGGKRSDVINHVYNSDNKDIIILDIPRSTQNISYNAIEEIKNGHITNDKYETGSCLFDIPHIIVFSNFYPDRTKLSDDRWDIYNINNDDVLQNIDLNVLDEE